MHIDDVIDRCRPYLSDDPDWSRALYFNPPSHDFLVWLIIAELMRREHKAPGPLKVTLLLNQGQLGSYDFGNVGLTAGYGGPLNMPLSYSNQMIGHVLRPAIGMIGAVNEPDMHTPIFIEKIRRHCEYGYFIFSLVDASRAGFKIPKWKVPRWAVREVQSFLKGERPVVITLRETPMQQERNSQLDEWIKFAGSIEARHPVLFLRDTGAANFPLGKWRTWPRASTDACVRAALYQQAYCNMMVCTGPFGWCEFSDAPYLLFKQLVPALPDWDHGNEKGWREFHHMEIGEQLPWASPKQRMTWKDDSFANLSEEFEAFV